LIHQVVELIKEAIPGHQLRFITGETFFKMTDLKDNFIFDLGLDQLVVSDNYFHYYGLSRGATVNKYINTKVPKDSFFSFDLSLHHELHICPLPKVESIFAELLFYKKRRPAVRELIFDPGFQELLQKMIRKEV
jgi:hypothetical protein